MIADPRLGSTSLTTGREDDEKGRGDDKSQKRGGGFPLSIKSYRPFNRIRAGLWRMPLEAMEL